MNLLDEGAASLAWPQPSFQKSHRYPFLALKTALALDDSRTQDASAIPISQLMMGFLAPSGQPLI